MISQTISHYRIVEKLGSGGMGVVYRARDEHLDRDVAIKVLSPGTLEDEPARMRFRNEALALSRLNHPNIATVHDFDTHEGIDFLVMEYIPGITLNERLDSQSLPEKEVIALGTQLADGLAAAHEQGVVHRDLKPGNLRLGSDGRLRILDFGLAKLRHPLTEVATTASLAETRQMVGTLPYMAPEQLRNEASDARTDLWAVGAVLYEMATGKRPFPETNGLLLVNDILSRDPEPPCTVNQQVSPGLEGIILKALAKDPANRYQNARQLRSDLERLTVEGSPLSIAPSRHKQLLIAMSVTAFLLTVVLGGLLFFHGSRPSRPVPQASLGESTSIAVLPFVNMSADSSQEYFSDGLSEELLNVLAKIPQLRVISRTSSFQFKGKSEDIRTIAKKLNVAYILEGSVRKSGTQIRVTAQLVNAADGSHRWSETYDRKLDDVFAVQDDIARSVASASKLTLLGVETPLSFSRSNRVDAYNLCLQGRYFFFSGSREDLERAISYYEQALKLDPGLATAWAGLAAIHTRQATQGFIPVADGFRQSRQEANRALELDPKMAAAHAALGDIQLFHDWDWSGADGSFQQALRLGPGIASVVGSAATMAGVLGRLDEAMALHQRATLLDPLNVVSHFNLALHASYGGRFDQAEAALRKVVELNPDLPLSHAALGRVWLLRSNPEAALKEMELERHTAWKLYGLALAYHALSRKAEADSALREFIEQNSSDGAFQIAEVYAYRGAANEAMQWLERAYAQRDPGVAFLKGDPLFEKIEGDVRYQAFLRKLKLL